MKRVTKRHILSYHLKLEMYFLSKHQNLIPLISKCTQNDNPQFWYHGILLNPYMIQ